MSDILIEWPLTEGKFPKTSGKYLVKTETKRGARRLLECNCTVATDGACTFDVHNQTVISWYSLYTNE